MPGSPSFALMTIFLAAFSIAAQSPDSTPSARAPAQDSDTDAKKPKKVWTNEDLPRPRSDVSVVGDSKNNPKPVKSKPADNKYVASLRKQLDKLQKQIADLDTQLEDLKSFSQGDPSNNASGMKLNKSYNREPIEVQIRALQDKKKDLQGQIDALLDEARKKGVQPGQLR